MDEFKRREKLFQGYMNSPEYQEKLIRRLQINDAAGRNTEARTLTYTLCTGGKDIDSMVEACIFFIENFGWTFDPRPYSAPHHLPFFLFDYQKKNIRWLIEHIEGGSDGFIEKSRDMGVSWIVFVMVPLWYWLFREGVNILLGSYKERLVDDRSKDSLFGMIDYAMINLPKWILPKGFNKDKHRNKLKLQNPQNFNLISGETMTPEFGRGTRKTVILFDELGTWEYAKDAWESAGDSSPCRIANSTPKGYNFYAMLRESGIDILTLHWKEHPMKDDKWYEFECDRRTDEEVAQELDISYNKSREGQVYPEWSELNVVMGDFPYDHDLPLYIFWDYGKTDDTAIIWAQKDFRTGRLRIVDVYRNNGKTIDFYTAFVTGIVPSDGYNYTSKDLEVIAEHKEWAKGTHFGDPAGRFSHIATDLNVFDILKQNGIIVNFKDEWKEFSRRKTATKLLIRDGIDLNKNDRTEYFNLCMINASYPKVKSEGIQEVRSIKPIHNWTAHYRSSFEYGALGLGDVQVNKGRVFDKFPKRDVSRRRRRTVGY